MFCKYCGKPLEEGEVCDCQMAAEESAKEIQKVQSEGTQTNQFAEQAGQAVNQLVSGTKGLIKRLVPLVKRPVSELDELIKNNEKNLGIQMIAVHTAINTLIAIIEMIVLRVKLGEYAKYMSIPYVKMVLIALFFTLIGDLIFAGILFLVTKYIFKAECTYGHMLILTGSKVMVESAAMIIGGIISIIYAPVGMLIIALGSVLGLLYVIGGYYRTINLSDDVKVYALFTCVVIALILSAVAVGTVGTEILKYFGSFY